MSKVCPNRNVPEFKALEAKFGFQQASLVSNHFYNADKQEYEYPTIEQAEEFFKNAPTYEIDYLQNIELDEYKIRRFENQKQVLNIALERPTITTQQKYVLMVLNDMIDKLISISEENILVHKKNKQTIDDIVSMGGKEEDAILLSPTSTFSVSGYSGASEFKGDSSLYIDNKNYGIAIHDIIDKIFAKALETNKSVEEVLTGKLFNEIYEAAQEKYPFDIEGLTKEQVMDDAERLMQIAGYYGDNVIFLPEISVLGLTAKDKNGKQRYIVGRADIMAIDMNGAVTIIDNKTKTVKNLLIEENEEVKLNTAYNEFLKDLATKKWAIQHAPSTPVGKSFMEFGKRHVIDTWIIQTEMYANMLRQNGIDVKDTVINGLFYQQTEDREYMGSVVWTKSVNDLYSMAYANLPRNKQLEQMIEDAPTDAAKERLRNQKTYESVTTMNSERMRKLKVAVDNEVPIDPNKEVKADERKDSELYDIDPDEKTAERFIKELKSMIELQKKNISKEINMKSVSAQKLYIELLKEHRRNIVNFERIIEQYEHDKTKTLARSTAFNNTIQEVGRQLEEFEKKMDTLRQSAIITDAKKTLSRMDEINKIHKYNQGAILIIEAIERVVNDINEATKQRNAGLDPTYDELEPMISENHSIFLNIHKMRQHSVAIDASVRQAYVNVGVFIARKVSEKQFNAVKEQAAELSLVKLQSLIEEYTKLANEGGLGGFSKAKHWVLSWMDKDYKKKLEESKDITNKAVLMRMQELAKQIQVLENEINGMEYTDDFFKKYYEGVTDPKSNLYIGSKNMFNQDGIMSGMFMDSFIATISNSELALTAFLHMYKEAEFDARTEFMEDLKVIALDKLRKKLLNKGYTLEELNEAMTEWDVVRYKSGATTVEEERIYAARPYSHEFKAAYEGFKNKIKDIDIQKDKLECKLRTTPKYDKKKNITKEYIETEEKLKEIINAQNILRDEYHDWLTENTILPYTNEYYKLLRKLPTELRNEIQLRRLKIDMIKYPMDQGVAEIDEMEQDDMFMMENEINAMLAEYTIQNPKEKDNIDRLNSFFKTDYNRTYFEAIRNRIELMYKDSPQKLKQWYDLNTISRPKESWYNKMSALYDKRKEITDRYFSKNTDLTELYEERREIINSRKPFGKFDSQYLTDEEIERLDSIEIEIDNIIELLQKGQHEKKIFMTNDDREELKRINDEIAENVTINLSEKYISYFDERYSMIERTYLELKDNERTLENAIRENKDVATYKAEYDATLKRLVNQEDEFRKWYDKRHFNTYISVLAKEEIDMRNVRQPKPFNFERMPKNDEDINHGLPNHKFYSMRTLREEIWERLDKNTGKYVLMTDDQMDRVKKAGMQEKYIAADVIRVLPTARNPEYMETPDGIPLPKGIKFVKNNNGEVDYYYIEKGYEGSKNIGEKFKKIQQNEDLREIYRASVRLYFSLQEKIDGKRTGYQLPGFAASTVENYHNQDNLSGFFKSEWEIFKDKNLKLGQSYDDVVNNNFGEQGAYTAMRHTIQLPRSMQSKDMIGSLIKYAVEAHNNIVFSQVAPVADAYIEYLKMLSSDLKKQGKKTIVREIDMTVEGVERKETIEETIDMSKRGENLDKMIGILEAERRKFQYGQEEHLNRTVKKILNGLFKYTAAIRIGADVINQTKNYTSGNLQMFIAMGSKRFDKNSHYTFEDWRWAKKEIYAPLDGFLAQYFKAYGNITDGPAIVQIYRRFNPMQKEFMKYATEISGGQKRRMAEKLASPYELLYFFQDKGDTEIGITTMLAIMNYYSYGVIEKKEEGKIIYKRDTEGNIIKLKAHECYVVNPETGSIEIRNDVDYRKEDEIQLMRIIHSEIRRAQGNYPKSDQTAAEEKAVNKMLFFFRKYVIPQFLNRFGYMRFNYEGSEVAYGYWRAYFAAYKYFGWKRATAEFILGDKLSGEYGISGHKLKKRNEKGEMVDVPMGKYWNRKIWQARLDAFAIVGISMLAYLTMLRIKRYKDDDEEIPMLLGNAYRVIWGTQQEAIAMNPMAGGSKEYIRNFTQGIPFMREFSKIHGFVDHATALAYIRFFTDGMEPDDESSLFHRNMYRDAFYQAKSGRYEKGDAKIMKDFVDLTGIKNIKNFFDPEPMIDVLNRNN